LYILKPRIIAERKRVIILAIIMALSDLCIPYISHSTMPMVNRKYMVRESERVSRVFKIKNAWGKKEAVVRNAAQ